MHMRAPFLSAPLVLVALAACNGAPTSPTVAIGPEGATTDQDLNLEVVSAAEDPDEDELFTSVKWFVNGVDAQLSGRVVPSSRTAKGEVWSVEVSVSDGALSAPDVARAEITIQNTPPVMRSLRLTPERVDTFGTLTATAVADDLDADPVDVTLTWYVDDVALEVTENTLNGDHFGSGSEVRVEAVAFDGEAESEVLVSRTVVVGNLPPSVASASISPELPDAGTDLTCVPAGWQDLDGDAEGYTYVWYVNGAEAGTDAVLAASAFERDDLVRCQVVPFDGIDAGEPVLSPGVVIANTRPSVGGVTIDTVDPKSGDELTYSVTGEADADGDTVTTTARWFIDGELAHEGQVLPAFAAVRDQDVTVEVVPFDGTSTGEPVTSEPVTIGNTAPEITGVTLRPDPVYTNDRVIPTIEVTDVDGDRVSYDVQWFVDGTAYSTAVLLDGAVDFDKGAEIQVELTPTDGLDAGAVFVSDTVTVQNSSPTEPILAGSPDEPSPGDELLCAVATDSTDLDGDTLTKELVWTKNGSPYTGATETILPGDTVPGSETANGDIFECTYTVTDGEDTVSDAVAFEVLIWRGPREFDTCGLSGASGPSQSDCDTGYAGTNLDGKVTVASGIQSWTAPLDGDYEFVVQGAAGGSGSFGSEDGYYGAELVGTLTLSEGDEVEMLIGQKGDDGYAYSAGGGGGTFVWVEGTLVFAAGGGGGNGDADAFPSGPCHGQAGTTPGAAANGYWTDACTSASTTTGEGGDYYYETIDYDPYLDFYGYAGGGAGYDGDGDHWDSSQVAIAIADGGMGGDGYYVQGGFGGGGAGGYIYGWYYYGTLDYWYDDDYEGAGGGGGYTGGDGGIYRGGGGSSFIDPVVADTSSSSGENDGPGSIVIDLLD